jgi:hypothetical protein
MDKHFGWLGKSFAKILQSLNFWGSLRYFEFIFISGIVTALTQSAGADTQSIQLQAGVNLISFSINPANPSPAAVFGSLGNSFVEASTYNNQTKLWTTYRNPSLADAATSNSLTGIAMAPISPGNGYSVRMSSAGTLNVTGTTPVAPSVTLYPGLNLVGFPLPSTAPTVIGMQDILNGPSYSFDRAFQWNPSGYVAFTNNGITDDGTYLYDRNKALWVESTSSALQIWTPQIAQPPLVYVERGNAIVVEAPIPEANSPVTVNVPVRLTRNFIGKIGFLVTGTAHPNTDFGITAVTTPITPTNSIGEFTVNAVASGYLIPVNIKEKPRLQTNSSVFMTLRRPVESPKVIDSGTLPQVAQIKITDGLNGIYEGFMKGSSSTATLNGQNFRIALRSNGQAIFDPGDGGLISSRFSLPYILSGGVPQFSGSASVSLASSGALRRTVTVLITPSLTIRLDDTSTSTPSYEVPLNLTFTNLTGAGPFQTTAKITLTQADPAL